MRDETDSGRPVTPHGMTRRGLLARGVLCAWSATGGPWLDRVAAAAASGPGRWIARAPLPIARADVGVAAVNGRIYILGGHAGGRVDQPFNQEYDPASDTWRDRAPMPRGLNHVAAAGLGGKVYAFGGFIEQNRHAVADAFEYDPAQDRWRPLAPLPHQLGAASAVALGGALHVVGGRDVTSIGTHQVYDPRADTWTERAPLPQGRDHMGVVAAGGRIHAIGGRFNTFDYNTGLHDVYDRSTDAWSSWAPLPTARSGVAAAVLDGWIFVFGGERAGGGAIYVPAGGLVNGGSRPSSVNEAFTRS